MACKKNACTCLKQALSDLAVLDEGVVALHLVELLTNGLDATNRLGALLDLLHAVLAEFGELLEQPMFVLTQSIQLSKLLQILEDLFSEGRKEGIPFSAVSSPNSELDQT